MPLNSTYRLYLRETWRQVYVYNIAFSYDVHEYDYVFSHNITRMVTIVINTKSFPVRVKSPLLFVAAAI